MEEQNFKNHTKLVAPFHFFAVPLLFFTFIGSLVNLYQSMGNHDRIYSAALITTLSLGAVMGTLFGRVFALKAQDRVIRLEENLRHQTLAGKPLDSRLRVGQIVGLRFASDAEFVALAAQAASKDMSQKDIKQAIRNWRVDNCRL